ncbi:hypothetical protein RASY3_06410 [Ruminococcus albus SY3]|uniref:DUF2953 domain-containing protein n=1 Tax=Ruminococcus albus SY3 TaxID=1341156 RepID=A0A011WRB6_RUMAL|nr:hypothetical protein [Ruminococcus albus]EXM39510.1 hypothetical protein RASY3_06410 [Ruminococcus albus SY3]
MTTTIILKILLIIIAVIVILLHFSVIVFVRGGTNSKFEIKVKYLWITLYPRKKKPKKPKKKRRKKAAEEEKKEEDILDEALEESAEEDPAFEDTEIVTDEEFEDISPAESIAEDKPVETLSEESTEDTSAEEETSVEEVSDDNPEDTPDDGKKKKRRRKKKEKKKEDKPQKEDDSENEEKTGKLEGLKKKWEFIKPYIPPAWKYSRKFMKAIRIEDVRIQIESGKEDAAKSATFYGKLQAALFNTLNLLAMIFTVRVKEANVKCLFNVKKLGADGEATIKVRPSTMIAIAFCLLFCAAKIFIPYKLKQRRARKKAEKEAKKRAAVSAVTEETA